MANIAPISAVFMFVMHKLTLLLIGVIPEIIVSLPVESRIIQHCKSKSLTMGTIFTCKTRRERVILLKRLSGENLRFLAPKIDGNRTIENLLKRQTHLAVILDGSCPSTLQFLHLDKRYFYESYHWLIFGEVNLEEAPLNINSDVTWGDFDVYNPASSHGGRLILTPLPTKPPELNKYWRRKNMTGVAFTSAVVVPDPELDLQEYLTSDENRQLHSMHRFQSVTIKYCQEMFNFSLNVSRTNSWGYLTQSGHFDGLVGLLERREIDFGSSPLIYKLDRMPVIDYSYGNWILRSTFIYRRPKVIEASYQIFLRPLSQTVWICIVIMMVLLMIFLKVAFSRETLVDSSWSFLFLFTMGAFCQQGATCYPKLLSSRTLSIFIFLFCILIYQFYSASIVSYLLMDPPRKINNLQDLADSNLKVGIENILIDRNYFVQTTDPVAIDLFHRKIKGETNDSGFYEPLHGLNLVKKGGFAFHVETSTAYPIIDKLFTNQQICELEEVQMYRTQPMHANLQKYSPFREMMNYCMLHLVEDGIMDRLRKHWDARKPNCIESAKKIDIHVGIREFSCGLIALSYGICISLLILGIEKIAHKRGTLLFYFKHKSVIEPYTE